jgi:hypothetical protein
MISAVFSVFLSTLFSCHPLHVSVTEIVYDEKEKQLEIISRIFVDDLETAIRAQLQQPSLDLLNPANGSTTDQLASAYVMSRLSVTLDGKRQKLSFLGSEKEEDALLCYIQVSNVKKWKNIEVTNSVIVETFDDQSNLVHITRGGTVKSLRLMKDNPSGKVVFDEK